MADPVRRRRKDAATDLIGGTELAGGLWTMPPVTIDAFLVMRMVAAEHRAGFRAWVALEDPKGGRRSRSIQEWDKLRALFSSAPMK